MTPIYTLHKLAEEFIIASNEEINDNDKFLSFLEDEDGKKIYNVYSQLKKHTNYLLDKPWYTHIVSKETGRDEDKTKHFIFMTDTCKKVIVEQNQIDFSNLSDDECKEIGRFDVEKLAKNGDSKLLEGEAKKQYYYEKGFIEGFQKSLELLSDIFTLDDISKIFVGETSGGGLFDAFLDYRISFGEKITFKDWYLKYSNPRNKIKSWEVDGYFENNKFIIKCLI
jgi:hypothetical protein